MSQDDLPPANEGPERRSLGEQMGATFGAVVWIAAVAVRGILVGLVLISWLR